ncbi:hypothetical protein Q3G72_031246 [Acer saccharum]|nr:hypothetical protein Q3G72_031246 [Acer saccharum]
MVMMMMKDHDRTVGDEWRYDLPGSLDANLVSVWLRWMEKMVKLMKKDDRMVGDEWRYDLPGSLDAK